MHLLSYDDQQEILCAYQRDFGKLIMEYNQSKREGAPALHLKRKADRLHRELSHSAHSHQPFFSEENREFIQTLLSEIRHFSSHHLSRGYSTHQNVMKDAA